MKRFLLALALALLPALTLAQPVTAPSNIATAQVSVTSAATQVATNRVSRRLLTVENTSSTAVYLGNCAGSSGATVTTSNGLLLPGTVGASLNIEMAGPLCGIVATGTVTVAVLESF